MCFLCGYRIDKYAKARSAVLELWKVEVMLFIIPDVLSRDVKHTFAAHLVTCTLFELDSIDR